MNYAFMAIKDLIKNNAMHRSGFRMQETTPLRVAAHASVEAGELLEVVWKSEAALHKASVQAKILEESADVVATVAHLLIMHGYSSEDLENEVLRKLKLRFSE